jgi:hypothetical protein
MQKIGNTNHCFSGYDSRLIIVGAAQNGVFSSFQAGLSRLAGNGWARKEGNDGTVCPILAFFLCQFS